jgi:hypothetical protein
VAPIPPVVAPPPPQARAPLGVTSLPPPAPPPLLPAPLPPPPTRPGLEPPRKAADLPRPAALPVELQISVSKLKRAELRRHLRIAQQLKVATLTLVAVLLLAAYPVYLFTHTAAEDMFGELDSLSLPGWAAGPHEDAARGSRWCIGECRIWDRTWQSAQGPAETQHAYEVALRDAGWLTRTKGACPSAQAGAASCWQRDDYVLDMWVRAPICEVPPPRPTTSGKASAAPTGSSAPVRSAGPGNTTNPPCPGALVTVKIYSAVSYQPIEWMEDHSGATASPTSRPSGSATATPSATQR